MAEKKYSEQTRHEMYLQPQSFAAINQALPKLYQTMDEVFAESYDALLFIGCGTSLYLAQTAAYLFSTYNEIPAKAVCCSELYYAPETYLCGKKTLVLPITRKSYTTEVRMAIDKARSFKGVKSLAITCDPDSAAYNDAILLSPETAEDSVVMTRSFTSMVYLAAILAMHVAGKNDDIEQMAEAYAQNAADALEKMDHLAARIIEEHEHLNLFVTLGQGAYYGIASECMNKMKEMGLSNSEAYYTLEYRHGPMSLVDCHTLILLLTGDETTKEDQKLMAELQSYGAVTAVIGAGAEENFPDAAYRLSLPYGYHDAQNAALIGMIGQTLGLHIAALKGLDADTPRHLSQAIVIR